MRTSEHSRSSLGFFRRHRVGLSIAVGVTVPGTTVGTVAAINAGSPDRASITPAVVCAPEVKLPPAVVPTRGPNPPGQHWSGYNRTIYVTQSPAEPACIPPGLTPDDVDTVKLAQTHPELVAPFKTPPTKLPGRSWANS